MDAQERKQLIADLEEVRATGITQTSTDGTSTSFDQSVISQVLRELKSQDTCAILRGTARPAIMDGKMPYRG